MIVNTLKGVGISICFTLILLLIFTILLTYTNINEQSIKPVIIVLTAISILSGSSIANMKRNKNGMLNGAMIGCFYFITMYTISSIIKTDFTINIQMIIITTVGIVFGMIGGIVGVNKK